MAPLFKGKANIGHNIKTEMKAGKPEKQALAIALNVARRSKAKKMAKGGMVNEQASSEHRPMPDEMDKDAAMVSRNSSRKAPHDDQWTDQPTVAQAQKPSPAMASRPPQKGSGAFSVRNRQVVDDEERLMSADRPGSKPDFVRDNEMDADGHGSDLHDMQRQHNNGRKAYAEGGQVMLDEDEAHMQMRLGPGGKEVESEYDEIGPDRQGPGVPDMERQHSDGRAPYAKGGPVKSMHKGMPEMDEEHPSSMIDDIMDRRRGKMMMAEGGMAHEMDDVPTDEEMEEHEASVAAAIMAKRRQKDMSAGSPDHDEAVMAMYEGGQVPGSDEGEVDLDENSMEQPNGYYGRNENAVLKENYDAGMKDAHQPEDSNMKGRDLSDEDEHDMVDKIRARYKARMGNR